MGSGGLTTGLGRRGLVSVNEFGLFGGPDGCVGASAGEIEDHVHV